MPNRRTTSRLLDGARQRFLLGTHHPGWLTKPEIAAGEVPLFVCDRRLREYKTVSRAGTPWACDSGGFTELQTYGRWTVTLAEDPR